MDYTKKSCTNNEGKTIVIESFTGEDAHSFLTFENKVISPIVKSIEYDALNEAFLVTDEFYEIQNGIVKKDKPVRLYFYLDFNGLPIGMAYTDALNEMFMLNLKEEETLSYKVKWQPAYEKFKEELGNIVGEERERKREYHNECARKMLTIYKK